MSDFIKGLELCESFFYEHGLPIIKEHYPDLRFSAGLLGYGSDVLGYDDNVSSDHMWGPRFYLFLDKQDIHIKDSLIQLFELNLPYTYKGYSVNFSAPDLNDNGVRHAEMISAGKVSPLIWIYTVDEFIYEYLGKIPSNDFEWVCASEHRLLGFTSGKLFVDMLDIASIRKKLSFYPNDVKLYLIASQWAVIAEEQAFVKRCGECDDDIGSRLVCARIVERLMRLCFLYMNKYAPYSKWFGTGFNHLQIPHEIADELAAAISANNLPDRETHLVNAQVLVAELHNTSNITNALDIHVQKYFNRDIDVIFTDEIAEKILEKIDNSPLKSSPLIGSLSQIGNFVELSDNPKYRENIEQLYKANILDIK